MPRPLRVYVPGFSFHVYQRGHNCSPIFHEDCDREHFLWLVRNAARLHGVDVHAYALMTNHYHLLATPTNPRALPKAMKQVDGGYVRYYNKKHRRLGTLWCARYRAKLIGEERYWLACLRYIERNPVQAGMVADAAAYRWSTYGAHAGGASATWLATHPLYEQLGSTPDDRRRAYRAFCNRTDDEYQAPW